MIPAWPTGTEELAPGVFAYVQAGGGLCIANAGIIADAGEGATVIDALFTPPMTRALINETRRVGGGRIRRLINTHHHIDHTLGNQHFPRETEIVAHARARAEQERVGLGVLDVIKRAAPHFAAELEGAALRLPDATFDGDALDLTAGRHRLRLLHFGTGHTRGDVLVHLPDERLLFAGDVAFFYVTPLGLEGHFGKWIDVCRRVEAMADVERIVPGHGPVASKAELREMRGYLELLYGAARAAFDAGGSIKDAVDAVDPGAYAEWAEAARLPLNMGRIFAELRGEIEG